MSLEIGSTTTRKLDPGNIGVAVGILSLCALELEICLGVILPPPRCRQTSQKPLPGEGLNQPSLARLSRYEVSKILGNDLAVLGSRNVIGHVTTGLAV